MRNRWVARFASGAAHIEQRVNDPEIRRLPLGNDDGDTDRRARLDVEGAEPTVPRHVRMAFADQLKGVRRSWWIPICTGWDHAGGSSRNREKDRRELRASATPRAVSASAGHHRAG